MGRKFMENANFLGLFSLISWFYENVRCTDTNQFQNNAYTHRKKM
jgi:hypothetical protein